MEKSLPKTLTLPQDSFMAVPVYKEEETDGEDRKPENRKRRKMSLIACLANGKEELGEKQARVVRECFK